jgi:hypothetical protein
MVSLNIEIKKKKLKKKKGVNNATPGALFQIIVKGGSRPF